MNKAAREHVKRTLVCPLFLSAAIRLAVRTIRSWLLPWAEQQEKNKDKNKDKGAISWLFWSFRCDYCAEQGYKITPLTDVVKELESYGFNVDYDIDSCFKSHSPSYKPVKISLDEFKDILINNRLYFDNTNNKPTQSVCCAFEEVDIWIQLNLFPAGE